MKYSILFLFLMNLASANIVSSPLEHLFVPKGFDNNDSVEVVVTGHFPNPCFSRNEVKVNIVNDLIDIEVTALEPKAMVKGSKSCPDMLVPFKETVSLGNLQAGEYKIRVNHESQNELNDTLNVSESSSNAIDDHIYAYIEWIERGEKDTFLLHGWNYSHCLVFDHIEVISNNKDTLSILPIMKQVDDVCPMKGMPVEYTAKLDFSSLKNDETLLYVRTMEGKSVSTVVKVK